MSPHRGVGEEALFTGASRNAGHQVVGAPVKEERHRVTVAPRLVDNPMNRGSIKVVGPPREKIADVHDKRARNRWRRDPGAVGMLDLKSACTILEEHCNSAPVGVRAAALFVGGGIGWLRWIVQQAKRQDWLAAKVIEIGFLKVERQSEAFHQGLGQALHLSNIR